MQHARMPAPTPDGGPLPISVIVLNHNGARWLEGCLNAVLGEPDVEVIVVDNASTDGSGDLVRRHFPQVRLLALPENLGFAAGNNRGAAEARGELLAFLNNDTQPLPGWTRALSRPLLGDPAVGLTTARIVYMDDPSVIDSAGDGYLRAGGAFKRFHGRPVSEDARTADVFGACGAACMIRRELFAELGGFDEEFFMVYEDVDLSFRARLLGYRCVYVADAVILHQGSATLGRVSPRAVYYGQRNLEWTYVKNMPASLLLRSLPTHVLYTCAAAARYGAGGHLGPFLRAKRDAIMGLGRMLRKRKAIQRGRRVDAAGLWCAMDRGWIRIKRMEKTFDLPYA